MVPKRYERLATIHVSFYLYCFRTSYMTIKVHIMKVTPINYIIENRIMSGSLCKF